MADFTYILPSDKDFYNGVKTMVNGMSVLMYKEELRELLNNGHCEIYDTGQFSHKRWDATGVKILFYTSMEIYSKYCYQLKNIQPYLLGICEKVMPPSAGYDILEVSVSPDVLTKNDTLSEIQDIVANGNYLNISENLVEKGKRMANAYVTLYALENHIRHFIDTTLLEKVGEDYMDSIIIPKKARSGIDTRKTQEQSKKWLPLRGDKDLYYLDFIDLADIIINNWDYFKDQIPDQGWIKVKIQEMYDIRCLIAHNSYISDDNIQLLELTTKQIISQLYL